MKLVWIINHSSLPPQLGGLNRHYYFSKYLSAMGYMVKIITASAIHNTNINIISKDDKAIFKEKTFEDVTYTYLKTSGYSKNNIRRIINLLQFPFRLKLHFKKLPKPDIIYASSPSPFAAFVAIKIAKKIKVPVILEVRDLWPETLVVLKRKSRRNPIFWLMYNMEKWMYKNADKLIFTMEGAADYIRDRGWEKEIDLTKMNHINNGVDLEEYNNNMENKFFDSDLEDSNFKIIYTGSIRRAYGLENVINAARILADTQNDIKIILWGDGDQKEQLERLITEYGLKNVIFKDRVQRNKIPYILSKADAALMYVNPLSADNLGKYGTSNNKTFDYFAAGKPIISNYQTKYDIVKKYNCGIVTEGKTAEDLADAILRLYRMPKQEYNGLCFNSKKAAKNYDYRVITEKVISILCSVSKE